jgi:hypothetical protein
MTMKRNGQPWIIGVDLDNTLIIYDELFRKLAKEQGLALAVDNLGKRELRDSLRRLPDGEVRWQELQAAAYGPRIGDARLADGARDFLANCHRAGISVYVISHKSELAGYDKTGTNLRTAALNFLESQGLFSHSIGLKRESVKFGATRQEKISIIRALHCTHFVDDLEETFLEETFPDELDKFLYAPTPPEHDLPGVRTMSSWNRIREHLFGN